MTLSETSVQGVDLENSESQMRDAIAKTIDDRVDELAQLVDRSLGGSPGGREPAPSVAPQPRVSAISFDEDEPHAEIESAQGSDESDDKIFYDYSLPWVPNTPDAALAPRALKKRSHLSSYVLALAEPLLLVTVAAGLAVVIRAGPTEGLGSKAPVIEAGSTPMQQAREVAAPDGRTSLTASSSAKPDQPIDVVATRNPAPPGAAVIPAVPPIPMVAADVPPDPSKPTAENSMFGTRHPDSRVSINPDATIMLKGMLEHAPLPPTRPKTLASTDTTVRGKPSDARAVAAGTTSFSIQLASSHSKSDALTTLSRLKKQFPDMLGGGSVHRADRGSNGVFYRVQAGPLSRDAADKACSRLKASGKNCIVVHS